MEPSREYPKHLYKDGDRNAADRVAKDADEEAAARADGFRMIGEPAPKATETKAKK